MPSWAYLILRSARRARLEGRTARLQALSLPHVATYAGITEKCWRPEMWGIIPAAGNGTRIQPLAFSKELLPVGSRFEGDTERPRAVSEYLIERMLQAGADKICFVISRWKFDILQ